MIATFLDSCKQTFFNCSSWGGKVVNNSFKFGHVSHMPPIIWGPYCIHAFRLNDRLQDSPTSLARWFQRIVSPSSLTTGPGFARLFEILVSSRSCPGESRHGTGSQKWRRWTSSAATKQWASLSSFPGGLLTRFSPDSRQVVWCHWPADWVDEGGE